MALFKRKEADTSTPPIAGDGSANYLVQQKTEARINAFDVETIKNTNYNDSDKYYYFAKPYFELLKEAQYFCGLWKYQTNRDDIKNGMQIFLNYLFLNGYAGWYYDKLQQSFIPVAIEKYKLDKLGNFYSGIGYNLYKNIGLEYGGDKTKYNGEKIILNKDNCAFIYYNVWLYGAWILWYDFVKNRCSLINQLISASPVLSKKIVYTNANENSKLDEFKAFLNPNNWALKISKNTGDKNFVGSNRIDVMEADRDIKLEELRKHIDYYLEYNYRYLGRRINVNDKQERNINSEVQYSQNNFDVIENYWTENIQAGVDRYQTINPLFDVKFSTIEISDETGKNQLENEDQDEITKI